jgi:nitrite reductase/ring-hydroxylating ferredoxin subunit
MADISGEQVGSVEDFAAGKVKGSGAYAVGMSNGEPFAVTRRCRHFGADLANGRVDDEGRLVCPWHQSAYDVKTGRMVRGPQGIFAKVPGLGWAFKSLTLVLPLGRGKATVKDGCVFVR